MSRFIRKAGATGGASYGDANVCSLLATYSGSLSASNASKVCCLNTEWELICLCNNISKSMGTGVEFTLPDNSEEYWKAFKICASNVTSDTFSSTMTRFGIGTGSCYSSTCIGCYERNCGMNTWTAGAAWCPSCLTFGVANYCGGNWSMCLEPRAFCPCSSASGIGLGFHIESFSMRGTQNPFRYRGAANVTTNNYCWTNISKVCFGYTNNCPVCFNNGGYAIYGIRNLTKITE